ncbi:hypothetical protein AB1N83_010554 [Pleurotus pulmonarius]
MEKILKMPRQATWSCRRTRNYVLLCGPPPCTTSVEVATMSNPIYLSSGLLLLTNKHVLDTRPHYDLVERKKPSTFLRVAWLMEDFMHAGADRRAVKPIVTTWRVISSVFWSNSLSHVGRLQGAGGGHWRNKHIGPSWKVVFRISKEKLPFMPLDSRTLPPSDWFCRMKFKFTFELSSHVTNYTNAVELRPLPPFGVVFDFVLSRNGRRPRPSPARRYKTYELQAQVATLTVAGRNST